MDFVSRWVEWFGPAQYVLDALIATGVVIGLLVVFIVARRALRQAYLERRDRRTLAIRQQWDAILDGRVPPETWRFNRMDREIVEAILTDRLEVASTDEAARLQACLRRTGLLDMRIHEARSLVGWRRRQALVSLGRMRAPEAIPALADALEDPSAETLIAAVRGLGRTELPEAAEPILERVVHDVLRVPDRPLQNALLACCRRRPSVLLPFVRKADDRVRPLLARVLGEVATPELDEDLLLLASDPLAEVRASAARALAEAKPRLALTALSSLAADPEWFVRLRAVVALGALEDPHTIPVLVETLCDPNRYVRLRSATALARLESQLEEIIEQVVQTQDRYALQSLVSELERTGDIGRLIAALADPNRRQTSEAALAGALRVGTVRILVDAVIHHSEARVRKAVAGFLVKLREPRVVAQLERMAATGRTRRQRVVSRWLLARMRKSPPAQLEQVPA